MFHLHMDPDLVCRNELCEIEEVHAKHSVQPPKTRRRRKRYKEPTPWLAHDHAGLVLAVERAVNDYPTTLRDVVFGVHNDYGSVSERTINRHLVALTQENRITTLDVLLPFAYRAYIKPISRLATIPKARDFLIGTYDGLRVWQGGGRYA